MKKSGAPLPEILDKTITACLDNGTRLLDESYDLEFRDPVATRFYLILIAQEEFAKAFILYLVREGIAPLNSSVQRAIKDHACKQLVGMILDYMIMHWEEVVELHAMIERDLDLGNRLPHEIASALELLCYEKISRWTKDNLAWVEEPEYDRQAVAISKGKKDRRKQDALYVRIGGQGEVCSTPVVITDQEVERELERAKRYRGCVFGAQRGEDAGFDRSRFDKVIEALTLLFESERRHAAQSAGALG
ncbi:MAG: AbiV family abortive infection protein [Alphaproteobacteria bacterium]|nr:AbiV family abortive infection protein [Alphaproteobacteria bacterium]MDE2495342.1 AbiV family abortive infection protein [Alphaproteobacteria bacterium]